MRCLVLDNSLGLVWIKLPRLQRSLTWPGGKTTLREEEKNPPPSPTVGKILGLERSGGDGSFWGLLKHLLTCL